MWWKIIYYYLYLFERARGIKDVVKASELYMFVKQIDYLKLYRRPMDLVIDLCQGEAVRVRWVGNDWEIEVIKPGLYMRYIEEGRELLRNLERGD